MEDLSGLSMLELFRLEAETQTAALSAGVLALETSGHAPAVVESLMRAAHSLKGAARIVGLEPAVKVAHAMEEVFAAAGTGRFVIRPEHGDVLLAAIDSLAEIAHAAPPERMTDAERAVGRMAAPHRTVDLRDWNGPWMDRADRHAEALAALLDGRPAPPVPAVPPVPALPSPLPDAGPASTAAPHVAPGAVQHDRVVRVSADGLDRLVGLAGEALIETRRLQPVVADLVSLRRAVARIRDGLTSLDGPAAAGHPAVPPACGDAIRTLREGAETVLTGLTRQCAEFAEFARRNESLSGRLHEAVIASRMRPFADGIRGLPRLVRDVGRALGKQVRLEVRGAETGVDRDILDALEAPLAHLVRNAIDHGIEPPSRRREEGKPEAGTIVVEARHRAGLLTITVGDDGAGIDAEALRASAVRRGVVGAALAERLTAPEVLDFLFLPGFSTREVVTEISGRGVGLDAVRSMVKTVGGSIRIATQPGSHTAFTLQLPITTSVIRALVVEIAGDAYAFPLARIVRTLACPRDAIRSIEGRHYVDHDGASIGLVMAAQVLDLAGAEAIATPDVVPVVVIGDHGRSFGLIVTAVLGERDLEVRPLDPRLGKLPDVGSVSLLETGEPALVLDVDDLLRSIEGLLAGRTLAGVVIDRGCPPPAPRRRILVVDDSITVRELERQLLRARGFDVDVAVDGMDGWNALRAGRHDLVVTDVDMPRLDGIGLISLIRSDPALRHLPVVIVSYKDREEDRLRGLEAGASRYLTKASFHDETFLHTITDLIGEPGG